MPEKRSSVYPPAPHPAPLSKVTPQRLKHSTPLHSTPRKSELIVSGFHSVTGRNYIAATNGDSVVYRNDFFTFRFPSGFRKRSTVNATARTWMKIITVIREFSSFENSLPPIYFRFCRASVSRKGKTCFNNQRVEFYIYPMDGWIAHLVEM